MWVVDTFTAYRAWRICRGTASPKIPAAEHWLAGIYAATVLAVAIAIFLVVAH